MFTFLCKFTHRAQLTVWTIKAQWLRFWCAMISMKEKSAAVNGIRTLDWIMISKRCHLFHDFELIYAKKISLKMVWFVFNWIKRCIQFNCWLGISLKWISHTWTKRKNRFLTFKFQLCNLIELVSLEHFQYTRIHFAVSCNPFRVWLNHNMELAVKK